MVRAVGVHHDRVAPQRRLRQVEWTGHDGGDLLVRHRGVHDAVEMVRLGRDLVSQGGEDLAVLDAIRGTQPGMALGDDGEGLCHGRPVQWPVEGQTHWHLVGLVPAPHAGQHVDAFLDRAHGGGCVGLQQPSRRELDLVARPGGTGAAEVETPGPDHVDGHPERLENAGLVLLGVDQREVAAAPFPDEDTQVGEDLEEEVGRQRHGRHVTWRDGLVLVHRRAVRQPDRHLLCVEPIVGALHEVLGVGVQPGDLGRPGLLQVGEHRVTGRHGERMLAERAREERRRCGGTRVVSVRERAAVDGVEVGALAGDDANGQAATHELPVEGHVGLDAEELLGSADRQPETDDHLVEDQGDALLGADLAKLSEELLGLQTGVARLNRLDEDGGEVVAHAPDLLKGLLAAVAEHDRVVDHRLRDADGQRDAALPVGLGQDSVGTAVVGVGEPDDLVAAAGCPGQAERDHDGLGPGVAERDSLRPCHLVDEFGRLTGELVLRTQLVTKVELGTDRVHDEVRLVPEEVDAVSDAGVDVLVTVEIPEQPTARPGGHHRVGGLLQARVEVQGVDPVGQRRAVLAGVLGRPSGLGGEEADELLDELPLPVGHRVLVEHDVVVVRADLLGAATRLLRLFCRGCGGGVH